MKKSVRELQTSETQRTKSARGRSIFRKQRRSRLKLEDMLAKLGPMQEISWSKNVGQEIW